MPENVESEDMAMNIFQNGFIQLFHTPYFRNYMEEWSSALTRSLRYLETRRKIEYPLLAQVQ